MILLNYFTGNLKPPTFKDKSESKWFDNQALKVRNTKAQGAALLKSMM